MDPQTALLIAWALFVLYGVTCVVRLAVNAWRESRAEDARLELPSDPTVEEWHDVLRWVHRHRPLCDLCAVEDEVRHDTQCWECERFLCAEHALPLAGGNDICPACDEALGIEEQAVAAAREVRS